MPGSKGRTAVKKFLREHRLFGIDTAVFIYWAENHTLYAPVLEPVFAALDARNCRAVVSTLVLLEVLVQPYRDGNLDLVNRLYALLSSHPGLDWHKLSFSIADQAARLRAEHNLRTPDSIHAATSLVEGATGFVCNDAVFRRVPGLKVLILDEVL